MFSFIFSIVSEKQLVKMLKCSNGSGSDSGSGVCVCGGGGGG